MAGITLFVAIMMVSSVKYYSFKKIDFRGKVPFFALLIVIFIFVSISIDPPSILFCSFGVFALSGPVFFLLKRASRASPKVP